MKFNKEKCKTCMFHGVANTMEIKVYCNYILLTEQACLYCDGKGTKDKRGNDFENCKLYQKGKRMPDKQNWSETHNTIGARHEDIFKDKWELDDSEY